MTKTMRATLPFESGQTLVTLLFFVIIAITITTGAVAVASLSSLSTSKVDQGNATLATAEGGIENAMMRLLRDANYSGETMTDGTSSTVITVTGSTTKTITSTATVGNFSRTIQATVTYVNNQLSVTSWKETF